MTIIANILTLFLVIPILGYFVFFIFFKLLLQNHRKAVHLSLDYSTILFILSVHFLILTIWGKSVFLFIFLIMCMIGIIFVLIHWKTKGEIILPHLIKGYWRFNFLLFFLAYISLILFGMIQRATVFVSIP